MGVKAPTPAWPQLPARLLPRRRPPGGGPGPRNVARLRRAAGPRVTGPRGAGPRVTGPRGARLAFGRAALAGGGGFAAAGRGPRTAARCPGFAAGRTFGGPGGCLAGTGTLAPAGLSGRFFLLLLLTVEHPADPAGQQAQAQQQA